MKFFKNILKFTFKRLYKLIYPNRKVKRIIKDIYNNYEKKFAFVFPSPGTPWGYLFQRPQQLAYNLAKLGYLTFFNVEGNWKIDPDNKVWGLKRLNSLLYLHNDFDNGITLESIDYLIIWRYWASQINFMKKNNNCNVLQIYDCIDVPDVHEYNSMLLKKHNQLIKESDLVIATSENIYNRITLLRKDVLLLPNACDYQHFSQPRSVMWKELIQLRDNAKVLVGYYGAIAEWFDFDLLKYCANKYKNWIFLLVGEAYPNILNKEDLHKYSNIIVWERVEYKKLSFLLSQLDITIIPFEINKITQAASPVKLFEYMAGGKPVVATNLKELAKYDNVFTADNKQEFSKYLKKALALSKNEKFRYKLKQKARLNSWRSRVKKVIRELRKRGLIE